MRIKTRSKFAGGPINVLPGDTLSVNYREANGTETRLVEEAFTGPMTFDEAAIVEGEIEDRRFVGGILIEKGKTEP